MTITLNLKPELEAGLLAQAQATGTTPEGYVQHLVERDLSAEVIDSGSSEGSGMVWENGLFIYRTGKPLPAHIVDDAIRRSREERHQHLLGNNS
jgi:hypothetical protein